MVYFTCRHAKSVLAFFTASLMASSSFSVQPQRHPRILGLHVSSAVSDLPSVAVESRRSALARICIASVAVTAPGMASAIELSSFSEAAAREKDGVLEPPRARSSAVSTPSTSSPLLSAPSPANSGSTDRTITHRVRLKLHIAETQASVEGREGLPAEDGEIIVGLYGKAAPKAVENFLKYCGPSEVVLDTGDVEKKPSLSKAQLWRLEPGVSVEVGRIKGLQVVPLAGSTALKYDNWLFPTTNVAEGNGLLHDRRGLLTRRPLNIGPGFEITLGEASQLDKSGAEVFGAVLSEAPADFLEIVERIPVYTYKAADSSGAVAGAVFQAQKKVYTDMAKNLGDQRFEDQRGKLLRKVDIRQVDIL